LPGHPELRRVDADFRHLFVSWFNRGFLNLRRIDWSTPASILEKIIRYDEAGVDQLLCYVQFGTLPHEKVMRNLELLGTQVIPELEKRGHRVDARAALV